MKLKRILVFIVLYSIRRSISEIKKAYRRLNFRYILMISSVISVSAVLCWRRYGLPRVFTASKPFTDPDIPYQIPFHPDVGCVLPVVNPYSAESWALNQKRPKIVCKGFDWVECKMSECKVKQHILNTMRDIVCYYKDIIYQTDRDYYVAAPIKLLNDEVYTLNRSDFFKVSCIAYKKNGYGLIASRWHGHIAGIRPQGQQVPPNRNDSLNVLVVGLDSTPRRGFIMKLPESYHVLTEELDAVVLKGYNVVGDGTPAALFPILSGRVDFQHTLLANLDFSYDTFFDPELFIFRTVERDGYHTAFYEDDPLIGTFQYRYNGFKEAPANHYLRAFLIDEYGKTSIYKWFEGISKRYCVGAKPTYLMLLDLTRQFMKIKGKRFGFTFMVDICHDDFQKVSTLDDDLAQFLRHIKDSGYLENTMLIVMGDHGPRYQIPFHPDVGCVLPVVNPYSAESWALNQKRPKIVCKGFDWVECKMSECKVKQHILNTMRDIVCYYKDIIYQTDRDYYVAAPIKLLNDEVYTLNRSDFFKVSCIAYKKNGYGLIASRWHGHIAGIRPQGQQVPPNRNDSLNVLVVGLDSTPRRGFIMKLPESYHVLTEELDAVVLKGYNVVGDGTPAALFPILSGRVDFQHTLLANLDFSYDTFFDPELFIFRTVERDGYHTAFYEDDPLIGTFQYRYNGFKEAPANHYLRAFLIDEYGKTSIYKWFEGISKRYCVGAKPTYLMLLDLTRQFMKIKGKRFGFTFMVDICHDDFQKVSTLDDDLAQFLRHIKDSGYLENTMLIVMGDHGPRYGPWRFSKLGKVDERLPFMSIVLPERLKSQRPNALHTLRANALVLTTPFDIHTTMLDAMGLSQHASDFVVHNAGLKRGLSLLEPIPRTRTCEQADISAHWCVCLNSASRYVDPLDPAYQRVTTALVDFINNLTQEARAVCAVRKLHSVEWVSRQDANQRPAGAGNNSSVIHYRTLILVTPGPAVFEGSMQFDPQRDHFVISERDISRISMYGSESACVSATHPHLLKYCYCRFSKYKFNWIMQI